MTQRNKPRNAAVFGIDIGKNVFHVVGVDAAGVPIQRATFRRETLLQFFERAREPWSSVPGRSGPAGWRSATNAAFDLTYLLESRRPRRERGLLEGPWSGDTGI